jgi:predicted transcriptional regulator
MKNRKYLFISIKEKYVNQILNGSKRIELRKSRPSVDVGDHVIIYCTSPIKAIVGTAKVENVISYTPSEMWRLNSKSLGINRKEYFEYYSKSDKAIGIVLSDVEKLSFSICLSLIKSQMPKFTPPQTYKYFNNFVPPKKGSGLILERMQ